MFRTIIWLLTAIIILIILLPVGIIVRLFQDKDKYADIPGIAKFVIKRILPHVVKLAGCDAEITGQENLPDGSALYVGNHQGDFDVLLILYAMGDPKVVVAKQEASKVPIANIWMNIIHCIFMNRADIRQSLQCIKEAEEYLKHGSSVLIFPEGTRSQGPDMNEFKSGAFKAAIKAGVPVVPFVIDGTYKVFEAQHYLKKADVRFSILPPVAPLEGEKTQDLSVRVQNIIKEELDRIRHE